MSIIKIMNEYYHTFKNILFAYKLITELKKVSDIYIKEFSMFLSICLNEKMELNYPFYEFDRIVYIIENTKELKNIFKHIFKKDIKYIDEKQFNKIYDEKLQMKFLDLMKKNFLYDSKCNLIKNVSVKFKINFNMFEEIIISNLLELKDLNQIIKTKHNISSNLLFFKDNKEIKENVPLIEYDIEDCDQILVSFDQAS
jgi:hypothetical protein